MSERELYERDHKEGEGERAARIEELGQLFAIPESGLAIGGGMETGIAFVEARRAYIEGLWLCTLLSATMAIERHIAANLYAAGDSSVVRFDTVSLLARAAEAGHISAFERTKYGELAKLRDEYARFRDPIQMVERLAEAGEGGLGINEVLQDDARMALTLAASYLRRNCTP